MLTSPRGKVTQQQMTAHFLGFGTLQEQAISTKDRKYITNMEGSNKFQEKLMLKQRQMEALMVENRVKKLKAEEERMQKQIKNTQKHS